MDLIRRSKGFTKCANLYINVRILWRPPCPSTVSARWRSPGSDSAPNVLGKQIHLNIKTDARQGVLDNVRELISMLGYSYHREHPCMRTGNYFGSQNNNFFFMYIQQFPILFCSDLSPYAEVAYHVIITYYTILSYIGTMWWSTNDDNPRKWPLFVTILRMPRRKYSAEAWWKSSSDWTRT